MSEYSVVIPTSSNYNHLVETINYVREGSKSEDVEIIVIDNASTDGTKEYLKDNSDIITITNEENEGFGKAVNKGIDKSTGEWILVLNDDALVPDGFLKKFKTDCKEYERLSGTKMASIAAPTSNYVGMRGQQQECKSRSHFEATAKHVYKQHYRRVVPTGIVSGLCLFINREVFDKIGKFDERFFAGCEDVDFSVRAYEAGFVTVVCKDIFVWHYGSKTIDRIPELKRGTAHTIDLLKKYGQRKNDYQDLGVIYRVKIRDDYDAKIFARTLEKSSTFADHIFILDDNSPYKITQYQGSNISILSPEDDDGIDRTVKLTCKVTLKQHDRSFDERRDRNELLNMAKEANMDWVFSLDADEVVEDKVDRKYMEKLINTPDPMCQAYSVHYYTFWNDEEHYNAGDVWKNMNGNRLVRLTSDPNIFLGSKSTFHVGNIPYTPPDLSRVSSIRIKHYGYVNPEQRQRKYEWYEKMDTDKNPALIGHKDYKHLINENPIILRKWIENSTISLCTIMKNEQPSLFDFLRSYTPFLDETVLLDTGSEDKSVWLAELFGCKVVNGNVDDLYTVDESGDKLLKFAEARNEALKHVTSDWILHMDIDEHLEDLPTIRRMLDGSLDGYMFYVNNLMKDTRYSLSETVRLFKKSCGFTYSGYVHETINNNNIKFAVGRAPMSIFHFGYLKADKDIRKKMQTYFKLNQKQIKDSPKDPRPYYAIAIHYLEEGFVDLAEENLIQAVELDNNFYQCNKDLAYLYLNKAQIYFNKVTGILKQDHPFYKLCDENVKLIDDMVGTQSQVSKGHLEGLI
jgi:GT2 family glycosyltransferase